MISDFLLINGVPMPEPGTFEVSGADLDGENATRLESGNMQRDRIWSSARQPRCKWNAIPQEETELLLNAIHPEEFSCTYWDPKAGRVTKRCYASQWRTQYCNGTNNYGSPLWDVSFDIIESSR